MVRSCLRDLCLPCIGCAKDLLKKGMDELFEDPLSASTCCATYIHDPSFLVFSALPVSAISSEPKHRAHLPKKESWALSVQFCGFQATDFTGFWSVAVRDMDSQSELPECCFLLHKI